MILHFRQMEHGQLDLTGRENPQALGLEESGVRPIGDLEYDLEAGLSGGGVWVCGSLRLPVLLECVGCLESFATEVCLPDFALQIEREEIGGVESLDLTDWVREDILLALPTYPRCDSAGGKTCPAQFPGVESAPMESLPSAAPAAWAALDALNSPPSQPPTQTN